MALNLKSLLFVSLFIALVAAPIVEATFPIRLVRIQGTVFCTTNGTIVNGTAPAPVFPLALVRLRCGGVLTVATAITNLNGVFLGTGLFPINYSLSTLLSTCVLRVETPLSICNSTLPSVGRLQAAIQFNGTILTGPFNLINITIVSPAPLAFQLVAA
ncbi:hypothetical protein Dsin_029249 [Dipteronia sinensis]|uniref:Uncharacterized protein n=1 Tax=Dipteronia sinensis TaxID=43782 RepID=A0AAD9ZS06_9ROSI|nr:hypothetical protein Dsin_029249 [Dipteronia sinensis]